jgi:hypothetical protein
LEGKSIGLIEDGVFLINNFKKENLGIVIGCSASNGLKPSGVKICGLGL